MIGMWAGLGLFAFALSGCTATRPPEVLIEPLYAFTRNQPMPTYYQEQPYSSDANIEMAQSATSPKPNLVTQ